MAERAFIIPTEEGFPTQFIPGTSAASAIGFGETIAALLIPLILLNLIPLMTAPITTTVNMTTKMPTTLMPTTPCPACPSCITPVPCSPVPVCPNGFMKLSVDGVEVPDKCYLFSKTSQAFFEHLIDCLSLGGYLANPATDLEAKALIEFLNNNDQNVPYYIGYTDFAIAGDPVKSIAGGPVPIPFMGNIPDNNWKNCITLNVINNIHVFGWTDCGLNRDENGICEVDLSDQMCVCP